MDNDVYIALYIHASLSIKGDTQASRGSGRAGRNDNYIYIYIEVVSWDRSTGSSKPTRLLSIHTYQILQLVQDFASKDRTFFLDYVGTTKAV